MWFRKLKVVNVGPFADLEINFTRGSVGIFGRNGRGKSTVLNLLYGLVTNDFSRFDGVKSEMIRNTADEKAESYVRGEIEHNGVVLDITRNFKPTKAKPNTTLVVGGGETITNATKAEFEIDKALGVDRKLLDLYVFKTQDKIYDFLTTVPSERAKAYSVLCRTEDCEKIWDMFGDFLTKDKDVNTVITDNSDELTQNISELKEDLNTLDDRKTVAGEKLVEDKFRKKYEERVRSQQRLEDLTEAAVQVETEMKAAQAVVKKHALAVDAKKLERTELQEKYDKRKSKAEDTRAALKGWEQYKKYRKRRKDLKDEAEALDVEGTGNKPPDVPQDVDKLEAHNKQLIRWEKELEEAQKTLAAFQVTGRTACPTCQTPVDHLKDHLEELREKVKTLPAKVKALEDKVEAIDFYKTNSRSYEKWKAGYDARVKANQDARDALKGVEAPDGDADELQGWLAKFAKLEADLETAEQGVKVLEKILGQAEATLEAKKTRLAEVRQGIDENQIDPSKVEKARTRLAEHVTAVNEIAKIEGEAKGVRKMIDAKEQELKALKTKLKRTKKLRQMAKVITEAREVVHRDRLPRRVASTNLNRMEGDINDNLKLFGDPFWAEANEELSFSVHKPGEPPQAAGRLSTGQRVILALAFWPAVASLWATDLGMLCLDEPTANLDAENRKFLSQALGAMTAKVRGERQLIMVTHDPDLRTAFDQVIDLGG